MTVTPLTAAPAGVGSGGYDGWRTGLPTAADANGERGTRLYVPSASIAA